MRRLHEYDAWAHMIQRCENPNNSGFKNYGGRGIAVCAQWRQSFPQFLSDMGPRPDNTYLLERRDNEGNYTPDNCVWATRTDQNRNRRNTIRITWNERTQTLPEWAAELSIPYGVLQMRLINRRWAVHRAFTHPVSPSRPKPKHDPRYVASLTKARANQRGRRNRLGQFIQTP